MRDSRASSTAGGTGLIEQLLGDKNLLQDCCKCLLYFWDCACTKFHEGEYVCLPSCPELCLPQVKLHAAKGNVPPRAPVQPSSSSGARLAVSRERIASTSNRRTAPLVVSTSRRQAESQASLAMPAPSLRGAVRCRPAGEYSCRGEHGKGMDTEC